jgi:cell division topological specificity factor
MSRLHLLTPVSSAPVARERLQNLLEHDRRLVGHADLVTVLREEIYALVGRHAAIDPNKVQVMVVRGTTASTLAVDIEVPNRVRATATTRRMHDGEDKSVLSYR